MGGADGHMSRSIAERFTRLKFIVQDLDVQGKLFKSPPHLENRMTFMIHDFFTPQPVRADAYLLRMICHDWPDDKSAEILRQLVPAMRDGTRIILMDAVNQPLGGALAPLARRTRYLFPSFLL